MWDSLLDSGIHRCDCQLTRRVDAFSLSSDAPHSVQFFQRHPDDDPARSAPGYAFIEACSDKIGDKMLAVPKAVAEAPPKRFAGGGYWEAMHDSMTGWHEVRVDGGKPRRHYRLFCLLDTDARDTERPALVVITGAAGWLAKPRPPSGR